MRISRRQFGAAAGGVLVGGLAAACGSHESTSATSSPIAGVSAQSLGYTVNVNGPRGAPGHVFFVYGTTAANPGIDSRPSVLVISDRAGNLVWQRELPAGQTAGNLRVQHYRGKPVLTWWQGLKQGGHGLGVSYIADEHYKVIATLTPGGDLSSDIHEFRLTADGRALISSYQQVSADLTAVGGPKDGKAYNCVASVIDVASRQTLFQWDAMSHVPIADSPATYTPGQVFDPYHLNSIALDPVGNLVISMRSLSTVFNIDYRTGAINWRLGGKHSTFAMSDGVEFAYQHDAEMPEANTLTLFDNHFEGNQGQKSGGSVPSSLKWIRLDTKAGRASLIRAQRHPANLSAGAMGNLQQLPGGNTFSGWGTAEHIAEFTAAGDMVYDATLTGGTYRAFLEEWTGDPIEPPQLTFTANTAHAVWNGATKVAQWRLLRGPQSNAMTPLSTVAWAGYDTAITLTGDSDGYYQLQALDVDGAVLNQSAPVIR
ncbi:Arylsulfotransferase (ASST) [Mycobacterium basiliense]|uniref:Arylsulfotransferase (ASST) n=1 Tax=Mycobacterium basiliense TaxID=2094119 RepID=A0A3S4C0A6_9MYCO|nr:arylsulfotransferase family protein [Mycobacterium basiliense]VDM91180.1 Arylsulfotransferase (ASST) [Mycobacterium basiliense]